MSRHLDERSSNWTSLSRTFLLSTFSSGSPILATWDDFCFLVLGKGKKTNKKDVDTVGVNPMPSGYDANSSHLCHTGIYKAIFSMKSLPPLLPAVWPLTFSFPHPKGYVVLSGWPCPGLSLPEEYAQELRLKLLAYEALGNTQDHSYSEWISAAILGQKPILLSCVSSITWFIYESLSN